MNDTKQERSIYEQKPESIYDFEDVEQPQEIVKIRRPPTLPYALLPSWENFNHIIDSVTKNLHHLSLRVEEPEERLGQLNSVQGYYGSDTSGQKDPPS